MGALLLSLEKSFVFLNLLKKVLDEVVHDRLTFSSLFREELPRLFPFPLALLEGLLSFNALVFFVNTFLLFHLPLRLGLRVP